MEYKHNDGGEWYYRDFMPISPRSRKVNVHWGAVPIAIASGIPLPDVNEKLREFYKVCKTKPKLFRLLGEYIVSLGFEWHPTMKIGQGCKVHLRADELPSGTLLVKCSSELVAVIDGVAQSKRDPRRDGDRCVYGYWKKVQVNNQRSVDYE